MWWSEHSATGTTLRQREFPEHPGQCVGVADEARFRPMPGGPQQVGQMPPAHNAAIPNRKTAASHPAWRRTACQWSLVMKARVTAAGHHQRVKQPRAFGHGRAGDGERGT